MSSKRARIIDKNPLSQTDSVLDSFQQYSKPESQQADKSTSQQVSKSTGQQVETIENEDQQPATPKSETPVPVEAKPSNQSASRKVDKSTSQQLDKLTSEPANQQESQEVNKPIIKKATFQLSEEVLQRLDTFHLQLQLEMGKANTPYKEVMVEEAIAQLLEQAQRDRAKLIAALHQRQRQRE